MPQSAEEVKLPEPRGSRFQNGAYRMVFSNSKNNVQSTHHNRMNLRDTSSDPSNIFGDSNLPSFLSSDVQNNNQTSKASLEKGATEQNDDDDEFDLNDR